MDSPAGFTLSILKELQTKYRVTASKALGQNFLVDANIAARIADLIPSGEPVIEIGPGIGSLTIQLARRASMVHAVEFDQYILDPLNDVLIQFDVEDLVSVLHQDAMRTDFQKLATQKSARTLAGNLPYNIAATLLVDIARKAPAITKIVAMVQKEVAQRLSADIPSRAVSAATYKCQFFMDVKHCFGVSKQSFIPQPRVDSSVITLERKEPPVNIESGETDAFFALIDTSFSQRRKMLRQSLKALFGKNVSEVFEISGVDPKLRPEQCGFEQFAELYNAQKRISSV